MPVKGLAYVLTPVTLWKVARSTARTSTATIRIPGSIDDAVMLQEVLSGETGSIMTAYLAEAYWCPRDQTPVTEQPACDRQARWHTHALVKPELAKYCYA